MTIDELELLVLDLASAVIAIQTTLGTMPQGIKADVKTFLLAEHNEDGTHKKEGTV